MFVYKIYCVQIYEDCIDINCNIQIKYSINFYLVEFNTNLSKYYVIENQLLSTNKCAKQTWILEFNIKLSYTNRLWS